MTQQDHNYHASTVAMQAICSQNSWQYLGNGTRQVKKGKVCHIHTGYRRGAHLPF